MTTKYNIGPTYLYTKVGHKRKQYQEQKGKIINKKGNSQILVLNSWEASWGKVLILDQFKGRGITLANRCFLCKEEEETIDHLLKYCLSVKMLWDLFLAIVGSSWVFPLMVHRTLLSWQGANVGRK